MMQIEFNAFNMLLNAFQRGPFLSFHKILLYLFLY